MMMSSVSKRLFSAAVAKSSKTVLLEKTLQFSAIAAAKNEEELTKATKSFVYDPNNIPDEWKDLAAAAATGGGASDKYVPDPDAWFNKPFLQFAAQESTREETWPFIMSMGLLGLVFWVYVPSILKDKDPSTSEYRRLRKKFEPKTECVDGSCHREEHAHAAHH